MSVNLVFDNATVADLVQVIRGIQQVQQQHHNDMQRIINEVLDFEVEEEAGQPSEMLVALPPTSVPALDGNSSHSENPPQTMNTDAVSDTTQGDIAPYFDSGASHMVGVPVGTDERHVWMCNVCTNVAAPLAIEQLC